MSFVPIEEGAVVALADAARRTSGAGRALRGSVDALVELSEDLLIDAVRRLRERGASEAQVEGYGRAFRARVEAVRAAEATLDAACDEVTAAAQELADV